MTDDERILVEKMTGSMLPGETASIYGSIQNYRRMQRKAGRSLSFKKAAAEWNERIFLPIISELNTDGALPLAAGKDIKSVFFPALYDAEGNGFVFRSGSARARALEKAHGLRALLLRLIA